jgi:hypothetical protein
VSTAKDGESGQSGKARQIRGRATKGSATILSQFDKRMKVYAYTAVTAILISLLLGVGWLYKVERVSSTDSILMFILAQILGVWVGLTNKIFRIINHNSEKESA